MWKDDVLALLRRLPSADTPPVCDWTKPKSKLLEKAESDLLVGQASISSGGDGVTGLNLPLIALTVAAIGAALASYMGLIDLGELLAPPPPPPPPRPKLFGIF